MNSLVMGIVVGEETITFDGETAFMDCLWANVNAHISLREEWCALTSIWTEEPKFPKQIFGLFVRSHFHWLSLKQPPL